MSRSIVPRLVVLKGWPSPSIVEKAAAFSGNDTAGAATGVLEDGKVGRLDTAGKWELGLAVSNTNQFPYIFRNSEDDADAAPDSPVADAVPVRYGSIQGLSLKNPLTFETAQYTGTPAVGNLVSVVAGGSADAGKFKVAVSTEVILGIVRKAPFTRNGLSYIGVEATNGDRLVP